MANPFMIGNTVNTEQYNTQKNLKNMHGILIEILLFIMMMVL